MDANEHATVETMVNLDKDGTPLAEVYRYLKRAAKRRQIPADRVTVIRRAFVDRRPARPMQVECVGHDLDGSGAKALKKRVELDHARAERTKAPGSVAGAIDYTVSAQEREAKVRRFDLEEMRNARGSLKQDADDVEEDDSAEGSIANPVDLTSGKNTERFSFGRASRVKAKGSRAKGSR